MAKLRTDAEEFGEEYSKRVKELTARKKLLGRDDLSEVDRSNLNEELLGAEAELATLRPSPTCCACLSSSRMCG
jgi:hypothetical protein